MTNNSEAARAPRWPDSPGELLVHIERADMAGDWIVSTDPADARDLCCPLRRTFRLKTLGDAECGIVHEYGHPFIVVGDFSCLLADLWRPMPLSDVIAAKHWATPCMLAFVHQLEVLFPREHFAPTTKV
ncbi:hypothetical protein [Cupriavidus oxalaticus]|uniref:Uncharacterized protein n=1 Tax=Cupriavidus oxalaticus TaxID=96344 RepID=A0A5P3VEN9_9BURK|nr:hypothetical protein [Cupriavidus oxalaticus]QEZ44720.1 hypothetical protein D2917_11060 [Cupriavidus oxalaticus]